jgi:hypothetical protein
VPARPGTWGPTALITIDVQADTLDGQPLEIAGTSAALPRMAELCSAFYTVVLADDAISGLYDRGREELTGIGVECLPTQAILERVATG